MVVALVERRGGIAVSSASDNDAIMGDDSEAAASAAVTRAATPMELDSGDGAAKAECAAMEEEAWCARGCAAVLSLPLGLCELRQTLHRLMPCSSHRPAHPPSRGCVPPLSSQLPPTPSGAG